MGKKQQPTPKLLKILEATNTKNQNQSTVKNQNFQIYPKDFSHSQLPHIRYVKPELETNYNCKSENLMAFLNEYKEKSDDKRVRSFVNNKNNQNNLIGGNVYL